jgi:hypothetical protein
MPQDGPCNEQGHFFVSRNIKRLEKEDVSAALPPEA